MIGLRARKILRNILQFILFLSLLGYIAFILWYMQKTYKDANEVLLALLVAGGVFILVATVLAFISFILRIKKKETDEIDWFVLAAIVSGTGELVVVTENLSFAVFGVSIAIMTILVSSDFYKMF